MSTSTRVTLDRVDGQSDDLHAAAVKLGLDLRHVTELGRADRREVLRVREQHRPRVTNPLVEVDRSLGGLCLEVRRWRAKLNAHGYSSRRCWPARSAGNLHPRRSLGVPWI